jgi:hypothetical protein
MIAGAFVMAVPDAQLLFAVRRADARIHVEHGASGRTAAINLVDPLAGKIGKRRKVLCGREPSRLEPPHLTRRGCTTMSRLPADDPSHRGIMARPLGVVDVLTIIEDSPRG